MDTRIEYSYGVIPIRQTPSGYEALLIDQYVHDGSSYWGFPKGHAEEQETPEESALRELREEVGITKVSLDTSRTFMQTYSFVYGDMLIEKHAIFFLGEVRAHELSLQANEVHDAQWVPFAFVRERLTYDDTKKLWDNARAYIEQKSSSVLP